MEHSTSADNIRLVIGNKNYSSWSLRPWLLLKHFQIPFQEIRVPLASPDTQAEIARWSPSQKVPVLLQGEFRVWDSLAISEYVSETFLQGAGWPADPRARALARSISAEMHAGFPHLRAEMTMNCRRQPVPINVSAECQRDIQRVQAIWQQCRTEFSRQGPWLMGGFSVADCMYAPVATRFASYAVELEPICRQYLDALLQHPAMQEWLAACRAESEVIAQYEY